MRFLPVLFCIVLFTACKHYSVERLTLATMQFPLLDEDNGAQLLPKSYKTNIIQNNVACKISLAFSEDFYKCSPYQQAKYLAYSKINKITFLGWLEHVSDLSDTSFYDANGDLFSYKNSDTSWHMNYRFMYDTLHFEIASNIIYYGVMRSTRNNLYYFDEVSEILYEVVGTDRNSFSDLLHCELGMFKFGRHGRLTSIMKYKADRQFGYLSSYQIKYKDGLVDSIISHHFWAENSYEKKVDCPGKAADSGVVKYYYTDTRLDSVVTHEFIKPKFERFRRTYYDERGLPVKTKFENYRSQFGTDWVLYKYIQR